jgi:general secretion pathway protein G
MKTNSRKTHAGFTLIELMAVITIIIILAGLVVGGMGFVNERQAKEKAKVQMALLEKAIEEYKLDMGTYPGTGTNFGGSATGSSGDFSQVLYTALFYDGYNHTKSANPPSNWSKATKIYLPELDPTSNKLGWTTGSGTTPSANLPITDPWGGKYRYRVGTNAQNPDFDLWSMGKDGKTRAGPNDPATHDENKDDIRNF